MDLRSAYYESRFEAAFLKAKGTEFQTFFNELMGRAFKSDYMPCRPWGNSGDRKNDGFLRSERRLFQAYAPNEMTATEAIQKIDEDFAGAKAFWGVHFDKWAFVHNAYNGIPPHVQKKMLDLEVANPGVKLDPWGLEELRNVFRLLEPDDVESWLGCAPDARTQSNIGFEELRIVLEAIGSKKPDSALPVREVPRGKIEANFLSGSIEALLKAGMTKASMVDELLRKWHDPTLGERIAEAFREKYVGLHSHSTPNEVFFEIQAWAGGMELGTPEHQMAVLTVIAYYFERCDIFEEPRA